MVVALGVWPAVGMLIVPVVRTIGAWTAGYLLLSLFLTLTWITLVSIAQSYQSRRALNPPRSANPTLAFRRWLDGRGQEFSG